MPSYSPLISLITINYNQPQVTREFLKSLEKLTYQNFEVIVIDNASFENTNEMLKNEFPFVRIFRSEKNLGFTGGNNLGMKLANGEYVLIINNDTEVGDINLLEKLLDPFNQDSQIGMVSPKIYYFSHPQIIQFAGYNKINSFTGRNSQIGDGEEDLGQHNKSGYTNYAHGAAMMVKREVIEKVCVFNDVFFLCYEELDWSAQVAKRGYKIFYQATTHILHKESVTMGKESPLKVYYNNRNRILFMKRNCNALKRSLFYLYYTFFTFPKNTLMYLLRFQFSHLKSFLLALHWNIANRNIYEYVPFDSKLENISLDSVQEFKLLSTD
jgi:GT2 family glycosyltransferase